MNIRQLFERIIKNWPIKAICIVLAMLIYFFHQLSLVDTKSLKVPLGVRAEGSTIVLSGLEDAREVDIRIRAPHDQIASITQDDITAFVDISSYTEEGTYSFPVHMELNERLSLMDPLQVDNRTGNVTLTIAKKETKAVPLYLQVVGEPAHGYEALSPTLTPEFVTVEGPLQMVEALEELNLTAFSIEGAVSDVTENVQIINRNSYITILDGDIEVSALIPIVEEESVTGFNNVSVVVENLSENLSLSGAPPTVSFELSGPLLLLEQVNLSSLRVRVNCLSITGEGEYVLPVRLTIPRGIALSSEDPLIVTLNVTENDLEAPVETDVPEESVAPVETAVPDEILLPDEILPPAGNAIPPAQEEMPNPVSNIDSVNPNPGNTAFLS